MTALAVPDLALRRTWAETVGEFRCLASMHGSGQWHFTDEQALDLTEAGCRRIVDLLRSYGDPAARLPDGMVHCDYLWITDGDPTEVIGFLALRHRLNDFLLEEGGHIGYSVRPSRRGQGHATRALGLAVRRSAALGLDRVLVTCDDDNLASGATIESNGGVQEDIRNGKRRYWIDTGLGAGAQPHSTPA